MVDPVEIPVKFVGLSEAVDHVRAAGKQLSEDALRDAQAYAARIERIHDSAAIARIDAERKANRDAETYLTKSERDQFASLREKLESERDYHKRVLAETALRHKQELVIATRSGRDLAALRQKQIKEIAAMEATAADNTVKVAKETTAKVVKETSKVERGKDFLIGAFGGYASLSAARQALDVGLRGLDLTRLDDNIAQISDGAKTVDRVLSELGNSVSTEFAQQFTQLGRGFNLTSDQIVDLARIARSSMPATGLSIENSLSQIIEATTKMSALRLDNLGLIVDVTGAQKEYARTLGTTTDKLTQQQKTTAVINETLRVSADRLEKYSADKVFNRLTRLNATLEDHLATLTKIAATDIINPLVSLFADGQDGATFATPFASRAAQAQAQVEQIREELADVERKRSDRSLVNRMPTDRAFVLSGISIDKQRLYEDQRAAGVALSEVREGLRRQLDVAERRAQALLADQQAKEQAERDKKAAEEENRRKADQDRQVAAEASKRTLAVRQKFEAEQAKFDERARARAQRAADERERDGESERDRAIRLLQENHARAITEVDNFGDRYLAETKRRHAVELVEAKASNADLEVLRRVQYAEIEAIKARSLDISAELEAQVGEMTSLVAQYDKAAAEAAHEALRKSTEANVSAWQKEIVTLTLLLKTRDDLNESSRAFHQRRLDEATFNLAHADPSAFAQTESELEAPEIAYATPALAALAELGDTDLSGVRDQLFDNVVTPLEIATETARTFTDGMLDAAYAALFEGQSFVKATNQLLKAIAKRSIKMAVFSFAQALFAMGTGQEDKAAELFSAAGVFAGLGLVSALGAAATGGLSDSKQARERGTDKPRGLNEDRGSGVTEVNVYATYNGVRTSRDDHRWIVDLVNEYAGSPGAPAISPAAMGR